MTNLPINQIIHGNCIDIMQSFPDESVDLIFADPPYNLQLRGDLWRPDNSQVNNVNDDWDHFGDYAHYDKFMRAWLKEAQRILKPISSIWVCGTYHNVYRVGSIMQDLGYWLLNGVTWYKRDATPNFSGHRLKNDVEHLIWAKRNEYDRCKFNHQLIKRYNDNKQLGSMWDIPKVKRYEQILDDDRNRVHNTQKPEALLERVLATSTHPGDIVLDPFFGTGTTGAVAKRMHRRWIGIELETQYITIAQARIDHTDVLKTTDPLAAMPANPRAKPVSFRALIAEGYLKAGQTLYLVGTNQTAIIMENGRLCAGHQEGTIHILCRHLLNVPSCNGWKIWKYIDENGEYHLINKLRHQYRKDHTDMWDDT